MNTAATFEVAWQNSTKEYTMKKKQLYSGLISECVKKSAETKKSNSNSYLKHKPDHEKHTYT